MVAIKPEYHYTKARALMRRAEKDAHMISKDAEHRKLMELAQMHLELYALLKQQSPVAHEPWAGNPYAVSYGTSTTNG